jgi:hypothetical protein
MMKQAAWKGAYIGTLNAITVVLSARLIVLIAVVGACWLTYLALQNANYFTIAALLVYCGGVVGSTVYLAGR